jgi:phosphate transport system substrate-binding protein
MTFAKTTLGVLVAATVGLGASGVRAADITGAGSTFAFPILSKWSEAYKKETNNGLNYQSIGSGGGIKQIQAKTVTFGATDAPLAVADLDKSGLVQFPFIMGGIVAVVNIDGVKAGELALDGETLANIYLGKIKKWDDAAIKKLNANLKLPSSDIVVAHRSDGSGTTFNFADYLSKVSPEWKDKIGVSQTPEWPVGVGAKGNEGVAGTVAQTKGSIGYVEYAYAKQNKLTYTDLVNKEGKKVEPTVAAFQAAAGNADWEHAPGYNLVLTNQPGAASWPITASTFILVYKDPADKAATAEAIKFFQWGFEKGGKMAEDLDYIPMPGKVVDQIKKTWTQIKK